MSAGFSRRRFLKASTVGVGVGVAVEACGGSESDLSTGSMPTPEPGGNTTPPRGSAPQPTNPGSNAPDPIDPPPDPSGEVSVDPEQPPPGGDPEVMPEPEPPAAPGAMPMRPLGKTGLMVSVVGFGSGSRYMRASEGDAEKMVHRAFELGIRYFDTARSYGSEPRFGKYLIPDYRDKIVLTSKTAARRGDDARAELERTLESLGTDHLDILHFHHIDGTSETDTIMGSGGAYEAIQKAKEEGLVRFIGVSGHSTGRILVDALERIQPDVVMCPQNAAKEDGFTDQVLSYGKANGIGLLGMKVTAQDALLRNGVQPQELLRYSLSLPVSAMIVGMRSLEVLESCVNVAKNFKPMTDAEKSALNGKYASLNLNRCLPYRRPGYRDGLCYA